MKIQYISTGKYIKPKEKIEGHVFFSNNLSAPFSLDDFDINIIDLNNIWENSNSENILEIDAFNDIKSLRVMMKNSKRTKFIIIYPINQNYNYKNANIYGEYTINKRKLLKDIISEISRFISAFLNVSNEIKIEYEKTLTFIGDSAVLADFYFNNSKSFLTKSSSDKITTIALSPKIYLTTLNFMSSYTSNYVIPLNTIISFLKQIKLIEEKANIPDWLETINFLNDKEEKEKIKENNKIINKAQEEIETSKKILDKNLYYKSILYATGDELVKVVFDILGDILDYNLNNFTDERKEDFLIKKENITFIGEIKGVNKSVNNGNISQLDNHYNMYIDKLNDENKEENVKALLIINYNRNSPINERHEIHENQINLAERNKSLIIPTYELLKLYEAFKQHRISSDEIEKMFIDKIGVFKYV